MVLFLSFKINANSNDSEAIGRLLDKHCTENQCAHNVNQRIFSKLLRLYSYGCLIIPNEFNHVDFNYLPNFYKKHKIHVLKYLPKISDYDSIISQQQLIANRLKNWAFESVFIARPTNIKKDFMYPFKNYCGNNVLLYTNNSWGGALSLAYNENVGLTHTLLVYSE